MIGAARICEIESQEGVRDLRRQPETSMRKGVADRRLIKMSGITKDYYLGKTVVPALRGIDLDIEEGEFVAVWGPSGSGKTTLLNLMGAIDRPTCGSLFISNQDVASLTDSQQSEFRNRCVGFVFQNFNLIPVLSALENIMLPLQIRGVSFRDARERAIACLDDVGLSPFAKHRPDNLSGGQKQRVAVARALATEPALVIADEPTANLDTETSKRIVGLLRELNERNSTTFVFSTHDQRLLDQVRRLIRLEDGTIVDGGNGNA